MKNKIGKKEKIMLAFSKRVCYHIPAREVYVHAPVAQLDRVTDYESVGRGFESLLAYQENHPSGWFSFVLYTFLDEMIGTAGLCCRLAAAKRGARIEIAKIDPGIFLGLFLQFCRKMKWTKIPFCVFPGVCRSFRSCRRGEGNSRPRLVIWKAFDFR